jgi:hypothetical protein
MEKKMADQPTVRRFRAERDGASVNAYLVETAAGVVAVDSLLTGNAVASRRSSPRSAKRTAQPEQARGDVIARMKDYETSHELRR